MTKKSQKHSRGTRSIRNNVSDYVRESLRQAAATLQRVVSALEATTVDDKNHVSHDDAELLASLMARLLQFQAEERKADAERRRALSEITHADVIAFLMRLKPAAWAEVKQTIDARHSGKSGLSQ